MLHLFLEIFKKVDRKTLILGTIEIALVIFLIIKPIFASPALLPRIQDNSKVYQDSIAINDKRIVSLQRDINRLIKMVDSLQQAQTFIKTSYAKKIKSVQTAPIDSVNSFVHDFLRTN